MTTPYMWTYGIRDRERGEGEKQVVYIRHSQITACIGGRRTPYVRMESFWRNIRFLRLSFLHIKHHHSIEKEHLKLSSIITFLFRTYIQSRCHCCSPQQSALSHARQVVEADLSMSRQKRRSDQAMKTYSI